MNYFKVRFLITACRFLKQWKSPKALLPINNFVKKSKPVDQQTKTIQDKQSASNLSFDAKKKLHSNITNTLSKQRVKKSVDLIEHFEVINISKPYKNKLFSYNTPSNHLL